MMLTRSDLLASQKNFSNPSEIYIQIFLFSDEETSITDTSEELAQTCLLECTKQVWATVSPETDQFGGNSGIASRIMIIAMFRSKDAQGAINTAHNLYQEFSPISYDYQENVTKLVNAPIANTKIGYDRNNNHRAIVLTTAVGPITIWVMSNPDYRGDDVLDEVDVAIQFANLQIQKLQQAGIIP